MIIRKLEKKENFSESETHIADFILSHKSSVIDMTAEELAKATFTSKASVLRLCKKAGASGYKEFQRNLLYEYHSLMNAEQALEYEMIDGKSTLRDIASIIPKIYESTIERTRGRLNFHTFQKLTERLNAASQIDIYGTGAAYIIAQDAAFKFNSIGKKASALSGINFHALEMTTKPQSHPVAVVLSLTGTNPYMTEIAAALRKNGIYVIGIGGAEGTRLKRACCAYIETVSKEMILSLETLVAQTSIRYILDLFFASLLAHNYDENLKASMRVFYNDHPDNTLDEYFLNTDP